jgi:hypothetical protein
MLAIVCHPEYYKLIPQLIPLIVGIRCPLFRLPCVALLCDLAPEDSSAFQNEGSKGLKCKFKDPFLLYHTTPFNLIHQVSRPPYVEGFMVWLDVRCLADGNARTRYLQRHGGKIHQRSDHENGVSESGRQLLLIDVEDLLAARNVDMASHSAIEEFSSENTACRSDDAIKGLACLCE